MTAEYCIIYCQWYTV